MAAPIPIVAASVAAFAPTAEGGLYAADGYADTADGRQGCSTERDALLDRHDSLETVRQPWAPSGGFLGPGPISRPPSWYALPPSPSSSSATVLPQTPAAGASLWQRALRPLLRLLCC